MVKSRPSSGFARIPPQADIGNLIQFGSSTHVLMGFYKILEKCAGFFIVKIENLWN